ncbi:MAG: hypothetical protein CL755_10620 [Chloroflexi bacterium]|nr:hypothetical protein [Chloroflexota bacterium]
MMAPGARSAKVGNRSGRLLVSVGSVATEVGVRAGVGVVSVVRVGGTEVGGTAADGAAVGGTAMTRTSLTITVWLEFMSILADTPTSS